MHSAKNSVILKSAAFIDQKKSGFFLKQDDGHCHLEF